MRRLGVQPAGMKAMRLAGPAPAPGLTAPAGALSRVDKRLAHAVEALEEESRDWQLPHRGRADYARKIQDASWNAFNLVQGPEPDLNRVGTFIWQRFAPTFAYPVPHDASRNVRFLACV